MIPIIAFATSGTTDGGLSYTVENNEVTITGYDGMATNLTLLDKIEGYPVTFIGDSAFSWCESLTSVIIPDSVTSIGEGALNRAYNLETVNMSAGIRRIESMAFFLCESLKNINIPDGVTEIGSLAFRGCEALPAVSIPSSVTEIAYDTFRGCSSLNSITVPKSVKSIDYGAFSYCEKLNDVYYTGTEAEFAKINVGIYNDYFKNATVHYNYVKPTTPTVEIKDTAKVFKDVKNKWYKNAVDYCYSHGFVSGVKTDEFGVSTSITRGMFVTILARIAGVDTTKAANTAATTKFTDVKSGKYYAAAVKWANENKVVAGLSDNEFGPNKDITRQQLCIMIVNFAKSSSLERREPSLFLTLTTYQTTKNGGLFRVRRPLFKVN